MKRLFRLFQLLIPGLLLLALVACSEAEEPAAAEPAAPAGPPAVAAEFPPPPPVETEPGPLVIPVTPVMPGEPLMTDNGRRGSYLTVAGMADFPHRDVHQEYQETLATLGPGLAYSRLLRVSVGPELTQPALSLECDLCESWELTPDMAYEFRLRPDVNWHYVAPVNGRTLVASDLVYSYERLRTPGWPGAARFQDRGIGEIEALDDQTLRVKLDFMDSDALLVLADGHSKIVAREVVEQYGDLKAAPVVGTGPWVWEQLSPATGLDFSRHPTYFEPGRPYLDGLTVKAVKSIDPEGSLNRERLALFQAGMIDVMIAPPTDWAELSRSGMDFNARVSQQPEIGVAVSLNIQSPPLDNPAVRRAIFRAVDPWEYVDVNWSGQGGVGLGMPLPGPDWQLARGEMRANYLASPSEARDILKEHRFYYPLKVDLAIADLGPDYLELGRQVAADLESVGFEPLVRTVDPDSLKELLFGPERDYEIVLGPLPPHSTTNGYLYALLHSDGPGNIVGHQDRALDALIERQAAELAPERRRALLLEVQRHVLEQAYMFSPVTGSYRWVFGWNVKDFYPNTALSEYHYWADAWLERG